MIETIVSQKNILYTAEILLDYGADVTACVPDSKYGDALSAATAAEIYRFWLNQFHKTHETFGWKGY